MYGDQRPPHYSNSANTAQISKAITFNSICHLPLLLTITAVILNLIDAISYRSLADRADVLLIAWL